jgi:hypothetical protein
MVTRRSRRQRKGRRWPPPPGEPVDLPTGAYVSWIRRVGAFIIDQSVYLILAAILGVGGGLTIGAAGGSPRLEGIVRLILALAILTYWLWNFGYRQGTTGGLVAGSGRRCPTAPLGRNTGNIATFVTALECLPVLGAVFRR